MVHSPLGNNPLDDVWDNRLFGYHVSASANFRGSRSGIVISLALLIFMLISFAILFWLSPNLVIQNQSLPSSANELTGVASPAPTAMPSNLMLQDPRYWRTVNVAFHSGRTMVIEEDIVK